jgi:small GTP-binding protein
MIENNPQIQSPLKHYKIVIGGDGAVGKSTLSKRLAGTFRDDEEGKMTFGIDFHKVDIVDGSPTYAHILDLGGQERFRSFQDKFFEGANIIILVFSVEWFHSFINLNVWLKFVENESPLKIYLIANKIDSLNRNITKQEGYGFAVSHNMTYYETSALRGTGVLDFKRDITQTIMEHRFKRNG